MATRIQLRRGTTAQHSTFTGAVGEITVDTDKDTVVVHGDSKQGVILLLRPKGYFSLTLAAIYLLPIYSPIKAIELLLTVITILHCLMRLPAR